MKKKCFSFSSTLLKNLFLVANIDKFTKKKHFKHCVPQHKHASYTKAILHFQKDFFFVFETSVAEPLLPLFKFPSLLYPFMPLDIHIYPLPPDEAPPPHLEKANYAPSPINSFHYCFNKLFGIQSKQQRRL